MLGKARAVANRDFAETIPVEADGHGNGHHGNGHAVTGEEHDAVGAPGSAAPPPRAGGARPVPPPSPRGRAGKYNARQELAWWPAAATRGLRAGPPRSGGRRPAR